MAEERDYIKELRGVAAPAREVLDAARDVLTMRGVAQALYEEACADVESEYREALKAAEDNKKAGIAAAVADYNAAIAQTKAHRRAVGNALRGGTVKALPKGA